MYGRADTSSKTAAKQQWREVEGRGTHPCMVFLVSIVLYTLPCEWFIHELSLYLLVCVNYIILVVVTVVSYAASGYWLHRFWKHGCATDVSSKLVLVLANLGRMTGWANQPSVISMKRRSDLLTLTSQATHVGKLTPGLSLVVFLRYAVSVYSWVQCFFHTGRDAFSNVECERSKIQIDFLEKWRTFRESWKRDERLIRSGISAQGAATTGGATSTAGRWELQKSKEQLSNVGRQMSTLCSLPHFPEVMLLMWHLQVEDCFMKFVKLHVNVAPLTRINPSLDFLCVCTLLRLVW